MYQTFFICRKSIVNDLVCARNVVGALAMSCITAWSMEFCTNFGVPLCSNIFRSWYQHMNVSSYYMRNFDIPESRSLLIYRSDLLSRKRLSFLSWLWRWCYTCLSAFILVQLINIVTDSIDHANIIYKPTSFVSRPPSLLSWYVKVGFPFTVTE